MTPREASRHPLVIIAFIFLAILALLKFAPKFPVSLSVQDVGQPLVVSAVGKKSVAPDQAKISFGIEASNSSLKQAQTQVNQKSQSLVNQLKAMGIAEKDIKTTSYNIYPEFDYSLQPAKINGYRVSISYEVKINDIDKVNDITVSITAAGANNVSGVSFELSDELKKQALNDARADAFKEAEEKAKGLAGATRISLGKIINISESQGGNFAIPLYERAVGAGGDSNANKSIPPPEIQPGQSEISVNITVSWEIR